MGCYDIRRYLIILVLSTIPFSGIFYYQSNTVYSDDVKCSSNDTGVTSFSKALFDYLFAIKFIGSFPKGITMQLTSLLLHSVNSLLLFLFLDDLLYFLRHYGHRIRRDCAAVMTVLFAANSLQIAIICEPTLRSLELLISTNFSLGGSIIALKFLKARNNNESNMICLALFLASCLLQNFAAVADTKSVQTTLITVVAVTMDKLRLHHPLHWVEALILLTSFLGSSFFYSSYGQRSDAGVGIRKIFIHSVFASFLPSLITIMHLLLDYYHNLSNVCRACLGLPAAYDPEYIGKMLESLTHIINILRSTLLTTNIFPLLSVVALVMIVIFLLASFLLRIGRGGCPSDFTFSCFALSALVVSAFIPSTADIGNVNNLIQVPALYTLEMSMRCYIPSCFLCICLGERTSYPPPSSMKYYNIFLIDFAGTA